MINDILEECELNLESAVEALEKRFTLVRAGRANPAILDSVMVEYWGQPTPLRQLATISVPEARQLLIKPFDKSCLANIEKGIFEANLGITPTNDGECIRISIPPLTEDRRKELVKQVKGMSEDAKVQVRNVRHDSIENLKKAELPEDEQKSGETKIQDLINKYNKIIETKENEKEEELMSI
ncbi:MAG: ribosome recycling factor [Methanobacteriaceae archaeon]|nr:ribosome recycling factor [Methanobacteriaceae archaeon]